MDVKVLMWNIMNCARRGVEQAHYLYPSLLVQSEDEKSYVMTVDVRIPNTDTETFRVTIERI